MFERIAAIVARSAGSPWAALAAFASILLWSISGPLFHFNETWQLLANTGTTIVTFLMMFILQNSQNQDGKAIQLKLDEIIRAIPQADNTFRHIEDKPTEEVTQLCEDQDDQRGT